MQCLHFAYIVFGKLLLVVTVTITTVIVTVTIATVTVTIKTTVLLCHSYFAAQK